MENKINIAELLKYCPQGMELDCTICNNVVTLEGVDTVGSYPIRVVSKSGFHHILTCEGYIYAEDDAKCVIFPKGKTTWEGFVPPCRFMDGDIVVDDSGAIFFYKQIHPYYEEPYADFYCGVTSELRGFVIKTGEAQRCGKISSIRYATEEEKQILFDAIKERGYRWNDETKTLEKLPKFKVGDRIILKDNPHNIPSVRIKAVTKSQYILENEGFFYISSADEKYVLEDKFDITTLKPFDKVLVRDGAGFWRPNFFGKDMIVGYRYFTSSGSYNKCIPYEGNEHLLGTRNDCDEYYKAWEK